MQCSDCQESILEKKILLLLCIKKYNLYKDLRKLLCSYLYVNCVSSKGCLICIDCIPTSFTVHPKICNYCVGHCCTLCFEMEEGYSNFVCKRCKNEVCINCVGICWCQCLECICKECVLGTDIPRCSKCQNITEIPVCEDCETFCKACSENE